jgi:LmbE family N-acetylglucosaminyl deacetylase
MITTDSLSTFGIVASSRILVVMPHPDDEAIFCGGLLHILSTHGVATRIITMTVGEKSTLRYGLKPTDSLAERRRKELGRALTILGVNDFFIYQYPDGGLEEIGEKIKTTIRTNIQNFRPTHVLTLEPDGIYGHPDHIALSGFTKAVVRRPTRLLYVTVSPSYHLPKSARRMAKKDVIKPILPDVELHLTWSDTRTKLKALRAHNSQFMGPIGTVLKSLIFFLMNHMTANEFFAWGN